MSQSMIQKAIEYQRGKRDKLVEQRRRSFNEIVIALEGIRTGQRKSPTSERCGTIIITIGHQCFEIQCIGASDGCACQYRMWKMGFPNMDGEAKTAENLCTEIAEMIVSRENDPPETLELPEPSEPEAA